MDDLDRLSTDDLLGHLLKRSGMLLNSGAIVEETRQAVLDAY